METDIFVTNINNPFSHFAFLKWLKVCNIKESDRILDPFFIDHELSDILVNNEIYNELVVFSNDFKFQRKEEDGITYILEDTFNNFPLNFDLCISKLPFLQKNSAKKKSLWFPLTHYDDLYKFALEKVLTFCDNAAVILPISYIDDLLFSERLYGIIKVSNSIFGENTCLALFNRKVTKSYKIYFDNLEMDSTLDLNTHISDNLTDFDNITSFTISKEVGIIGICSLEQKSSRIKFVDPSKFRNKKAIDFYIHGIITKDLKSILKRANKLVTTLKKSCNYNNYFSEIELKNSKKKKLSAEGALRILTLALENN